MAVPHSGVPAPNPDPQDVTLADITADSITADTATLTAATITTLTTTLAGELAGTPATATVDALHGGSTHAAAQAAAEATAAAALTVHEADATAVHGIADTSALATATDVSDHTGDATAAHAASAVSFSPIGTIAGSDTQTAVAEVATDAAAALSSHAADGGLHGGGGGITTDLSQGSVSNITATGTPAFLHFPGVTKMSDGRLLVVYRQGTDHATTQDGKIVGKIGTVGNDYVVAWGSQFTIFDDGSLDCRDPEAATLSDGTLIVSFFTWDGANARVVKTCRSTDLGATWETPVSITTTFTGVQACSAKVVELPSGDLLLPIYGDSDFSAPYTAALVKSTDGGDSWGSQVTIVSGAVGTGNDWNEPYIAPLADGRLHCLIRENTDDEIWRTVSEDGGATWSTAAFAFDGDARPAHIQVQSGGLLYASRAAPFGDTVYRESADYGVTWTAETVIDTAGTRNEYASIVQIDPYRYGVAYGIHNTDSDADVKLALFTDAANLDIIRGLAESSSSSSSDGTVKVSADDATPGYLNGKLVAGANITLTEGSGGADETLTIASTGGSPVFTGAKAYNTAVQSIPDSTDTALTLNTEDYDSDTLHSTVSLTSRMTVNQTGKWRFSFGSSWSVTSATGARVLFLRIDGTTRVEGSDVRAAGSTAINVSTKGTIDVELTSGQYVEVVVFQNSGGALDAGFAHATNAGLVSYLSAQFLG